MSASGPNQVQTCDAGTDKVQACDTGAYKVETRNVIIGGVLGACGKCECAFHGAIVIGFFSSDLHDKGQVAAQPDTGQQTALYRPPDFS